MSKKNKTEKLFFSKTLDFLDYYLPEQARKSVNTLETYRDALTVFADSCQKTSTFPYAHFNLRIALTICC